MTASSGGPSGRGGGLGVLDETVKLEPFPRKRLKRLGLVEVLGVVLGVKDRERGNDCEGVS